MDIKEKIKQNKAELMLSLIEVGFNTYKLILDNTGESVASNVNIICKNEEIFGYEAKNSFSVATPIEPHQALLIHKFYSSNDILEFKITWKDNFKKKNENNIDLKKDCVSDYEARIINLYKQVPGDQAPVDLVKAAQEIKAYQDIKDSLKKMHPDASDDEIEKLIEDYFNS